MAAEPRTSPVPYPRRPQRSTGPTAAAQRAVRARDGGVCVVCGLPGSPTDPLVIHHRVNRGMGGSKAPEVNEPASLLIVHASINGAFEADPRLIVRAYVEGWKVKRPADPATVPVRYPDGWWLLDNDGGRRRP